MEIKDQKNIDTILGTLLILPIYIVVLVILNLLKLNDGDNTILFPILMYLPVIIGIIIATIVYKKKVSITLIIFIAIFLFLAIYFYYQTYFIDHENWDGLTFYLFWLINTITCKILSCVFYGKITNKKKVTTFIITYIIMIILSVVIGFWE